MRKLLLPFACLFLAFPALAQNAKPQAIASLIHADAPLGEGTLKRLFIKVYDASVWTDAKEWSMDAPFALSMYYHLDLDADDLVDSTVEELQHVHALPPEHLAAYKDNLTKIYPNLHSGDTLTAVYTPHKSISFYHNDQLTGTINDPEFAEHFFQIWYSPDTSEPKLRLALLGKHVE